MATIDVSKTLGEYMLKGWVLTAETCSREHCSVPMMRSPKGQSPVTTFCANCDGTPDGARSSRQRAESSNTSPSSYASTEQMSRASTPPTEISSGLSSPTFALPVETAESVRRRQQSDAASAEIGKRLLKGWAMLADECPNSRCFGVPLVRPPLAGGKDPKKECVACGTIYIDEKDAAGWMHLVPMPQAQHTTAGPSSSPATTRYDSKGKEKAVASNVLGLRDHTDLASPEKDEGHPEVPRLSALEESSDALNEALHALSQRLSMLTNNASTIEPASISSTAEAMSKVLEALSRAKALTENTIS